MSAVACIDGGKSELRLLVTDGERREYGVGPGLAYHPHEDGVARILDSVRAAVAMLTRPPAPTAVVAGLTAMPGDPAHLRRLTRCLEELFGGPALVVEDGLLAHAGALAGPGTVICAGTGTTVLSIGASGRRAKVDGWGPALGDRGSAYAIGLAGMRAATAAHDGTGPTTRLTGLLERELGGTDLAGLQEFYRDAALVARIAGFAREVVATAEHDAVAGAICDRAAADLAASAAAAVCRLPEAGSRVSWSGRFVAPSGPLHTRLAAALADRGLDLLPPVAGPLEGGPVLLRREEPYRSLLRTET
ncbi:N-acetylglucosamine kinase [Nonomuraea sp. NPDC050663]|uniref:N-acetylglucosamine kinase n=1 Tax=Nonomuraea sp. NPDC050663 TaxID=3364370 RepID=UPI0037B065C7